MFLLRHFRLFKLGGISKKAFSSAQYSVLHEHRVQCGLAVEGMSGLKHGPSMDAFSWVPPVSVFFHKLFLWQSSET